MIKILADRIALVLLVTAALAVTGILLAQRQRPFDAVKWTEARATKDYNRLFTMSDSLVERLQSKDLSRDETIRLLGEPDIATKIMLQYRLGVHRRGTILPDGWDLTIYFDLSGKAMKKAFVHPG